MVVHTSGLCRRFGGRWALSRLDLDIQAGEKFLIMGENGGGKTTLLSVLATVIPRSRGSLSLFGMEPERHLTRIRQKIAFLAHLPSLYEDLSAAENLGILFRLMGASNPGSSLLEQVGLDDRPDPVRSYSAGMRKRLSFARVLAQRPDLALLDEPFGQLDPEGFNLVELLVEQLASRGCTVVMASHLVDRASRICDRALLIQKGLPRWQGPAASASRAWGLLYGHEVPRAREQAP